MKNKKVSIGGQAVIEGVMMRGESSMATAVRDSDGVIRLETKRLKKGKRNCAFLRLPLIRGIMAFGSSLFGGIRVLMRSAEVFGEGEPSKFEKWCSEKFNVNIFTVIGFFSMMIALVLAVLLFMFVPQTIRGWLENLFNTNFNVWATNFIEGGIKLVIFISYILICSLLKDVRRTFMYHGAEHKTITCFERGLELSVENARKCKRVHDRCGTTFIVFVMLISIIVFACFEAFVGDSFSSLGVWAKVVRIACKVAFLPIVAGISYELLKALSKTNSRIFFPLKVPGLLLQLITTKEPDDQMLEVAIKSFKTVYDMDRDLTIPEVEFVVAKKRKDVLQDVKKRLLENGIDELSESEWIVSISLGIKRDEVYGEQLVRPIQIDKINKIVDDRITGKPLWYCVGDTEFYGYTIKVDQRALIPRPETEILVSKALEFIKDDCCALDLCTGSGAIAIAIYKESLEKKVNNLKIIATDVSADALDLAKENALNNDAKIEFLQGDLFESVKNQKFDIIISNPPYIKRKDIDNLQTEVKDFEPIIALDGGSDGLDFYRKICQNAKNYLKPNGILLMECGFDQSEDIKNLLCDYSEVKVIKDYENIDRIILAVV